MYKSFIKIALVLVSFIAGCGIAVANTHLVIHFQSGDCRNVEVTDGLKVAFEGGEMTVAGHDDSAIYSLDDVSRISYMRADESGAREIADTSAPSLTFTPSGAVITADGRHRVDVVDTAGRSIMSCIMTDTLFIPVDQLPAGVVIVTVDSRRAIKIATR